MLVFPETKDPNEEKTYRYDWTDYLGGETIASQTVVFVDAAGTTKLSDSASDTISSVKLGGGTNGGQATFAILIVTNSGAKLEQGFGVDIVDSVRGAPAETDVERLTRMIAEAKAQRHNVALGTAAVQIWRNGRGMKKSFATMAELDGYIRVLESELSAAQVAAGVAVTSSSRRRPILLAWPN